jgi:hypothetical protein
MNLFEEPMPAMLPFLLGILIAFIGHIKKNEKVSKVAKAIIVFGVVWILGSFTVAGGEL